MPDPAAQEKAPEVRPFAAVLQELRKGLAHGELSEALAEVVAGVIQHEKDGTLTLQIKVKAQGDGEAVKLIDKITKNVPRPEAKPTVFFADERGNVSRRHPRQQELPLRAVDDVDDDDQAAAEAASS